MVLLIKWVAFEQNLSKQLLIIKIPFFIFRNSDGLFKSRSHAHVGDELENTSSRVRRSMTQAAMPRTIGELQAKLKQSGDSDWRKRIPKLNNANEELSLLKVKNIYNVRTMQY